MGSVDSSLSVLSAGSLLSAVSAGCILSLASSGSVLSIGSAGSILSVGSVGSILSVGSLGSVLSIGSAFRIRGRWEGPPRGRAEERDDGAPARLAGTVVAVAALASLVVPSSDRARGRGGR